MRPSGHYVIAGLLVLASLPIYYYVYRRAVRPDVILPARVVPKPKPGSASSDRVFMTHDEAAALDALGRHRAKCVEGVVYRIYDHVIEPWPGGVRCFAPVGVMDGPMVGVSATGHGEGL